jgi:hypothetical protein
LRLTTNAEMHENFLKDINKYKNNQ